MSDEPRDTIALAWLHHQGYSGDRLVELWPRVDDLARAEHEALGCEFDANHGAWNCSDEYGESNHGFRDVVGEALEIANVVVETLGLHRQSRPECPELRDGGVVIAKAGPMIYRWVTDWRREP